MKSEWIWMPHAAHFICGNDCRFHLATKLSKDIIVSTVGEYLPDSNVRDILAESRGIRLVGKGDERRADWMRKLGFEKIGFDRLYETMVFRAKPLPEAGCCPWEITDVGDSLDFEGYNIAADAYQGHLAMCEKWDKE